MLRVVLGIVFVSSAFALKQNGAELEPAADLSSDAPRLSQTTSDSSKAGNVPQVGQVHFKNIIDPFDVEMLATEEGILVPEKQVSESDKDAVLVDMEADDETKPDEVKAGGLRRRKRHEESPSQSVSPSVSPSSTQSLSPSTTPSLTSSGSPSHTSAPSASTTPTVSPTSVPSVTPSRSWSSSASISRSASATSSVSRSSSPSQTPSVTPTISLSPPPSDSSSQSFSPKPSPPPSTSPSMSVSAVASVTPTVSVSSSPTQSLSPSASPTVSNSASTSFSPSMSTSVGATQSNSVSLSPSPSLSSAASITPSISFSTSLSSSNSLSPSISLSPTISFTPSTSPSPTVSPLPLPPLPTRAVIAAVPSVEPFMPHPLERSMYAEELAGPWSYDENSEVGPDFWYNADKSFKSCSESSKSQSPIDLYTFRIASPMSPLLTPQYNAGQVLLRNTGNYLRLIPHHGSLLFWGDKIFELVYIQIHTPSEHHISGETFPVELQFVHKAQEDNQLAVLALLYSQGQQNAFIERVLQAMPVESGKEAFFNGAVNLADAIPKDITQYQSGTRISYPHYTYDGSLTTPPCSENVRWFVWAKPDHISKRQIDDLRRLVPRSSARGVQNINQRVVEYKSLF